MKRLATLFSIPMVLALLAPLSLKAQRSTLFSLDLEAGLAFSGYNKIQGGGTGDRLFNAYQELRENPRIYYRIRPTVTVGRHAFSALFAPLKFRYTGSLADGTGYDGQSYSSDRLVNLDYKLNAYHLTYRFNFLNNDRIVAGLGVTAKFRDYAVQITDGSVNTRQASLAVQPLVNAYINGWITDRLGILIEGDAFGLSNWRTEDVFVGATYRPFQNLTFKAGYRIQEGGTSLRDLHNFSLVNYLGGGVILNL